MSLILKNNQINSVLNKREKKKKRTASLRGKVLFSEMNLNPKELFYYLYALWLGAFYLDSSEWEGKRKSNWLLM